MSSFDEFSQKLQTIALLTAQKILEPQQQLQALCTIAQTYAIFYQPEAEKILSQALAVAQNLTDTAAKAKAIATLAVIYAEVEAFETAQDLLTQASAIAIANNCAEIEQRRYQVALRLAKAGRSDRALSLMDQVHSPQLQAAFKATIEEVEEPQAQQLDPSAAAKSPDAVTKPDADTPGIKLSQILYTAEQYALNNRREQAVERVEQALKIYKDLQAQQTAGESYLPFSHAYITSGMATILATIGQPERGLQLIQDIEPAADTLVYKAAALMSVGEALRECQQQQAAELFEQALELAQSAPSAEEKVDILSEIASRYINADQPKQGMQILEQAVKEFSNISSEQKGYIAFLFYEAGNYDRALEIAKLSGDEVVFDTLMDLVAVYVEAGDYEKAFAVVEAFNTADEKALALADIAVGYAQSGKEDQGYTIMVQAIQAVQNDADPGITIGLILSQYLDTGQTQQVIDLLEFIKNPATLSTVFTEISNYLDSDTDFLNLLSQRLKAAITNPKSPQELAVIAEQYARMSDYEKALSITAQIKDPGAQSQSFSTLARIYCKNKHQADGSTQNLLQSILETLNNSSPE